MPQRSSTNSTKPTAARDLIVCFDGMSNEFGRENTNVVRLVQSFTRNPDR